MLSTVFSPKLFVGFVLLVLVGCLQGQTLTSSNLPIVVVNTPILIPDEPKVNGFMGIIDNGPGVINNLSDPFNHYNGNIAIESRGNSTQGFEKKSYGFETRDAAFEDSSVALLGMGGDEDWILHSMVIDKSQLRIPMSFDFFRGFGHYASNWRYVELVLNGDYRGVYILTEKIKRDDDRVDIARLDADDLAGDSVTGGYILRIDWLDDFPVPGFASSYDSQSGDEMYYQWNYPKEDEILPEQAAYIKGYMDDFEEAVFSPTYSNSLGQHYMSYINVRSFTDFLIVNELAKNADGYKLSSFLHKDKDSKGGRLNAGPIWDFDQTYGVSTVCSCQDPTGWTYLQNQPDCEDLESMPMWWQAMMNDPAFQDSLGCRWAQARSRFLHKDSIYSWIDTHESLISSAIGRNFTRWNHLGQEIWYEPYPFPATYAEEITYLKNWISQRLNWLDINMPAPADCGDFSVGLDEEISASDSEDPLKIFPNPSSGVVYIEAPYGEIVTLRNSMGQLLLQSQITAEREQFDLSGYPQGVYFFQTADGKRTTKLLLIH